MSLQGVKGLRTPAGVAGGKLATNPEGLSGLRLKRVGLLHFPTLNPKPPTFLNSFKKGGEKMVKGEYINVKRRVAGAGWHGKCSKCLDGRGLGYCSAMIRAVQIFRKHGIKEFAWECPRYKTSGYRLVDELGMNDGKTPAELVG
jgi:hypothetical protein